MINLDFSIAVAVYCLIVLMGIFFYWLLNKKHKEKLLYLNPKYIWFCSVCTHTYIYTGEDTISTCPCCGSYNKKNS